MVSSKITKEPNRKFSSERAKRHIVRAASLEDPTQKQTLHRFLHGGSNGARNWRFSLDGDKAYPEVIRYI